MSTNIIEHIRRIHSEIEIDKKHIINDLQAPENKHKKLVLQCHRIKSRLKRISENQNSLITLYKDSTGALSDAKTQITPKNNLAVFYSKLNETLMQKKTLNQVEQTPSEAVNAEMNFSGEEFYGRYVEMNGLYREFLNIKGMPSMYLNGIKKIDYKLYLEVFDHFHNIPQESKSSVTYRRYLENVLHYLQAFYQRRFPLHPFEDIMKEISEDFGDKWEAKSISGWQKEWAEEVFQQHPSKSTLPLEEKKKLIQKAEKKTKGENDDDKTVFCAPCDKEFKSNVYPSHIKGKKHKRNASTEKESQKDNLKTEREYERRTAFLEFAIKLLKTLLLEIFEETCYYIEKKLTRSYAETQKELEQREIEEEEEEILIGENVESKDQSLWSGGVYNPKKVPLGWDGRPIPYWLYKFHGLNIGYKCEICGGTKYYGPRAFQQHFKEWKHANGMKALGIPNTKHFNNVTKIEEAEALYQKLKEKKLIELFNPDLEEEFEDHEGNVYGKQTYEALKRQRVI